MNAAFHDSAKALPSSQLMTLRETHVTSLQLQIQVIHLSPQSGTQIYTHFTRRETSLRLKKKSLVQEFSLIQREHERMTEQ